MIDPLSMIGGQQATDLGHRRSHSARKDAPQQPHRARRSSAVVANRRRSTAKLLHALADVVGGERHDVRTEPAC